MKLFPWPRRKDMPPDPPARSIDSPDMLALPGGPVLRRPGGPNPPLDSYIGHIVPQPPAAGGQPAVPPPPSSTGVADPSADKNLGPRPTTLPPLGNSGMTNPVDEMKPLPLDHPQPYDPFGSLSGDPRQGGGRI